MTIAEQLDAYCTVASTAIQAEDEDAWLLARTRGVGGSDVGAICGVNPWSSALQIYFSKTGQYTEEPSEASKERMHFGHVLEPIVAQEFVQRNSGLICAEANCTFSSRAFPFLLANVDRFVLNESGDIVGILECKTAGAQLSAEWENGEIPISYFYQVQHYMFVTGVHKGWICCLVGGNKFFQYDIFFDEDLYTNTILPQLCTFWNDYVLALKEPPTQSADNSLFDSLFNNVENEEPLIFPDNFESIGQEYLEIKQRQKQDKKRLEELQAIIKGTLQDHITGYSPTYEFKWSPRTKTSIDSSYLKVHYPDIYDECARVTHYRQMNVKGLNNEDTGF